MQAKAAIFLLFPLAILGCVGLRNDVAPALAPALVKDELTHVRCPELAEADKKMLTAGRVKRPWTSDTGASTGQLLEHIDKQDVRLDRTAAAGGRVVREFDACRDPGGKRSPTS